MVSWRGLLLALVLLVVVSAAAGAASAYWILKRYTLHLPMRSQQMEVQLPEALPVEVEVIPHETAVPEDEPSLAIPVRVKDTFRTRVHVETQVPVRMSVPYRGEIPVDLDLPVKTMVKTRVLGVPLELPVEGIIPLHFSLPVDLMIPIDQTLPMKFDLPVSTQIDQVVTVRVRARQAARIRLGGSALPVTIQSAEIEVPLSWLSLIGPGNGEPQQVGPLVQPPLKPE